MTPNRPPAGPDEVITLVREICRPLEPERVALANAPGRVLREPVCAPADQPSFDRSAVDGYAVRLDDPGPRFQVVTEIRAGEWKPGPLQRGEAVRISTGAALPCDGLQIVMKEDTAGDGASLEVRHRTVNRNIRFRGEDARQGQMLLEAPSNLQPGALGLLASLGQTAPLVTRLPRVLHATTGDEIVPPEQTPGLGQIRDSNSTLVGAFLKQWGVEPRQIRLPEDEDGALVALRTLLPVPGPAHNGPTAPLSPAAVGPGAGFDLLLISGGASVGEHDFTRRLLEQLGYEILVSRTTTRPGKPLIVARHGGSVAFGLPGNPLAHYVCLNLYVRMALDAYQGLPPRSLFRDGLLDTALETGANPRETFWPARCRFEAGQAVLTPLRWSSSGDLTSLATANALLRVRAACPALPVGTPIEFVPTFSLP
jgi:molybdopterin molybdotransferase